MTRLLNLFGAVALLGAAGIVVLCAREWSGDSRVDLVLQAEPNVVRRFTQNTSGKSAQESETAPALVVQARAFATILRPPSPALSIKPAPTVTEPPAHVEPPSVAVAESPKFKVFGTSRSESHPERSMALVAEPGQESEAYWVKEGSSVGHFVVHEIRDGKVICLLGEKPYELAVEPQPSTATALASDSSLDPTERVLATASSATAGNPPAGPLRRPGGATGPRVGSARSAAIN
jgi:hypothetical protein